VNQYSRFALLAAALIVFLWASASPVRAQDAEEEMSRLVEEWISLLNQQADILATIKDEESGRAAAPKLLSLAEKGMELAPRIQSAAARLTRAEDRRLQGKYESRLREAAQRLLDEVRRIREIPGIPVDAELARVEENLSRYTASGAAPAGKKGAFAFIFPVLLFLIFLGCVGFRYAEGMWGNAIQFVNVVTAALLAMNFWEPFARFLENSISRSLTYFWDFLALWILFIVFLLIFRMLTSFASRVKVRFLGIVDRIGGIFFAVLIAWVILCFTTVTLHTAPLARNFLFGGFDPDSKGMFIGLPVDRQWLSFTEHVSSGSFSRSIGEDQLKDYGAGPEDKAVAVFDRQHQFIPTYAARRAALDSQVKSQKSLRSTSAPKR
jgi:hypothetical protein